MKVSIELTFTPLQDDFEKPIQKFIKRLRSSEFEVQENPLSTHIYGEYAPVMEFLTEAIEEGLGGVELGLFNMKIVKTDRSRYVPDF